MVLHLDGQFLDLEDTLLIRKDNEFSMPHLLMVISCTFLNSCTVNPDLRITKLYKCSVHRRINRISSL